MSKEKAYCTKCGRQFTFNYRGSGAKRSVCNKCKQKRKAETYAEKTIIQLEYLEKYRKGIITK